MNGISLTTTGKVARLRLERPAAFNALTPNLLRELIRLCDELSAEANVGVVVFEGAGEHFCSGADLREFMGQLQADPRNTADLGRQAKEAIATLPQVTIAAIKGYCIGGGIVLSGACDMRIAADSSKFSIPELDAGIPLSWGGMADLVRLIGESSANDLVLTCRPFLADEALRIGFISRIVESAAFVDEVSHIAEQIAAKPAIVLRQTKAKLRKIRARTFNAEHDADEMVDALNDDEALALNRNYVRKTLGG